MAHDQEQQRNFERLTLHHAECHKRFADIEAAMHAAAPLVPKDTPAGAAWHAEYERLVAWRAAMYDPEHEANQKLAAEFVRDILDAA